MKTSVFVGVSLDGFIARSNGVFDFLSASGAERVCCAVRNVIPVLRGPR
jgi:hypothetical protein